MIVLVTAHLDRDDHLLSGLTFLIGTPQAQTSQEPDRLQPRHHAKTVVTVIACPHALDHRPPELVLGAPAKAAQGGKSLQMSLPTLETLLL